MADKKINQIVDKTSKRVNLKPDKAHMNDTVIMLGSHGGGGGSHLHTQQLFQ